MKKISTDPSNDIPKRKLPAPVTDRRNGATGVRRNGATNR